MSEGQHSAHRQFHHFHLLTTKAVFIKTALTMNHKHFSSFLPQENALFANTFLNKITPYPSTALFLLLRQETCSSFHYKGVQTIQPKYFMHRFEPKLPCFSFFTFSVKPWLHRSILGTDVNLNLTQKVRENIVLH